MNLWFQTMAALSPRLHHPSRSALRGKSRKHLPSAATGRERRGSSEQSADAKDERRIESARAAASFRLGSPERSLALLAMAPGPLHQPIDSAQAHALVPILAAPSGSLSLSHSSCFHQSRRTRSPSPSSRWARPRPPPPLRRRLHATGQCRLRQSAAYARSAAPSVPAASRAPARAAPPRADARARRTARGRAPPSRLHSSPGRASLACVSRDERAPLPPSSAQHASSSPASDCACAH
mmetsp:Transcript_12033/g.27909  ORF Transcript_12033/g.27909 Transcript_12033/m.27909 type:complete len:238 (-) Transcript_12033:365-1078(-)